jgi:hypothetical protein
MEGNVTGEGGDILFWGEKSIMSLKGSQASPVRPSDKGSVKVKTLRLLEAAAWDRDRGILSF